MNAIATPGGRIGPNAITQVAAVLTGYIGRRGTTDLFASVALAHHLTEPPQAMVDESDVRRLHGALRGWLGPTLARQVARSAGERTAAYLLAHRIPRPVQWLLRALPAGLAARVLMAAISRHAWTFAGSGQFTVETGPPLVLVIRNNPMCAGMSATVPACEFYAATFQTPFAALVQRRTRVREIACEACGDEACRFVVSW